MDKIVVYCGTRNHYPIMEVAAKSLLSNTAVDRVFFLIEDDAFTHVLPPIISTVNVSDQSWFDTNGPNYFSAWTYMAYLRLAFAKIFPQYDQVLYLDTDTIVLKNISSLINLNLGPDLFAMVREDDGEIPLEICNAFAVSSNGIAKFQSDNPRPKFSIRPYYNSGVMLMNLRKLRETKIDDALLLELNTIKHDYPDQDVINLMCHNSILALPQQYNVIPALQPDFPLSEIAIKHYASDKPLWKSSLWQSYKRIPWDVVMQKQNELKSKGA